MQTEKVHIIKKRYFQPSIEVIKLDNGVSLALESDPPTFESENRHNSKDFFCSKPFADING